MPTNNTSSQLDWNEGNFDRVLSDLYQEIESDADLRQRFLTDPFEVLSARIAIPERFRGGILLVPKGQDSMVLYTPNADAPRVNAEEGTSEEKPQKDYEVVCTLPLLW